MTPVEIIARCFAAAYWRARTDSNPRLLERFGPRDEYVRKTWATWTPEAEHAAELLGEKTQ